MSDSRVLKAEAALADLLANLPYSLWPREVQVLNEALEILRSKP